MIIPTNTNVISVIIPKLLNNNSEKAVLSFCNHSIYSALESSRSFSIKICKNVKTVAMTPSTSNKIEFG